METFAVSSQDVLLEISPVAECYALPCLECGQEWLGVPPVPPPHQPDGVSPQSSLSQSGLLSWPDCIPSLYTVTVVSRGLSQDLAEMPAEERRLVAEEGSYSLKTWLLKTEDVEAG